MDRIGVGVFLLLAWTGCSVVIDDAAVQCETDLDCQKYVRSSCNPKSHLCVATAESANSSAEDARTDHLFEDGAVPVDADGAVPVEVAGDSPLEPAEAASSTPSPAEARVEERDGSEAAPADAGGDPTVDACRGPTDAHLRCADF